MRLLNLATLLATCLTVVESFVPRLANSVGSSSPLLRLAAINDNDDDGGMIVMSNDDESSEDANRRNLLINTVAGGLLVASGAAAWDLYKMEVYTPTGFTRLPTTQFLAALADPTASSGTGADQWGLWRQDPGPRGVWLRDYASVLQNSDNVAPRGWKFDPNDFWIEEHGECVCSV